ncbi:MAG TPA: TylF/MycF/NovP-related O-methyltransferase [Lacibacter sp.]|nr:TylF/MycF/NovP-related O-methyltransferase [Lacibacter sp.]
MTEGTMGKQKGIAGKSIKRWLLLKFKSISMLPFILGKATFLKTYLTYHPDSYIQFGEHQEFKKLLHSFKKKNLINNSGDITRLWSFILNIKQVINENIPGDFAELGVWRGNTASILAHYAFVNNRRVYLFDTFEGFHKKDLKGIDADKKMSFSNTSVELVKNIIGGPASCCELVAGYFPDSVTEVHSNKTFAIVSIDCDLYEPMKAGLEFFYPLMPTGGIFLLHDYSSLYWEGAKKAIDDFCKQHHEYVILMPDKSGSAFIRKTQTTSS